MSEGLRGLCLPEGVQLLCLIDKAADACRYLQTYGEWNRAAWLAKVGAVSVRTRADIPSDLSLTIQKRFGCKATLQIFPGNSPPVLYERRQHCFLQGGSLRWWQLCESSRFLSLLGVSPDCTQRCCGPVPPPRGQQQHWAVRQPSEAQCVTGQAPP